MLKINTSLPENCKNCFAYDSSVSKCRITGCVIPDEAAEVCICDICPLESKPDLTCKNERRDSIKVKDFLKITNYPLVFVCDITNWSDTSYLMILNSDEGCNPTHLLSEAFMNYTITALAVGRLDDRLVQVVEILDDNI